MAVAGAFPYDIRSVRRRDSKRCGLEPRPAGICRCEDDHMISHGIAGSGCFGNPSMVRIEEELCLTIWRQVGYRRWGDLDPVNTAISRSVWTLGKRLACYVSQIAWPAGPSSPRAEHLNRSG